MQTSRREFLELTTVAAGAAAFGPLPSRAAPVVAPQTMRVLVLGGTGFIGPHIVKAMLDAGHEVSIFTRGQREMPFSGVKRWLNRHRWLMDNWWLVVWFLPHSSVEISTASTTTRWFYAAKYDN